MRGWPKHALIRGRTWGLLWQKGLKERLECFGITLIEEQTITLDDRPLNPQQNAEVVVHEALHACYASTSLPHVLKEDEKDGRDYEETIVDSLSPAVLSLIVDNPELIARIQEEYAKGE